MKINNLHQSGGGGVTSSPKSKFKKITIAVLSAVSFLSISSVAKADFACEAFLCFAGGKGVSECRPTIKKVIRDLARGKAFPHCSFLSTSDVSTSFYQERVSYNDKYCPDGETIASKVNTSSKGKYGFCNTIELKINPEYSADEEHQIQKFYYQKY